MATSCKAHGLNLWVKMKKYLLTIIAALFLPLAALAQQTGPIYATPYMRSFLYSANQAAAQAYLGVGASGDFVLRASGNATNLTVHTNLTLSNGNIILGANYVSGDGGNEGISISSSGMVLIGTGTTADTDLVVASSGSNPFNIFRNTGGTSGVSMSFQKNNSTPSKITFGSLFITPSDATAGSEDSDFGVFLRDAGSLAERHKFTSTGRYAPGGGTPTARIHIPAGTTAAGTSPLKFTSGTNLTTPEAGATEYDGTQLYFSPSTIRYNVGLTRTPTTVYAAGTAYALTATSALLDFGTTDPTITLTAPGTYLIRVRVRTDYAAATFAASQEVTYKLRRTNNTAADLTNASAGFATRIVTSETSTADNVSFETVYTTANADDIIQLWGSVAVVPGAGALNATAASIVAIRLY